MSLQRWFLVATVLCACTSSTERIAPDAQLDPRAPQSDPTRVSSMAAATTIGEQLCPVEARCYQPPPSDDAIARCVQQEVELICSSVDCSGTSASEALAACVAAIDAMTCADSFPKLCDAVFRAP
jgi:hypothetical protein